MMLGDVFAGIQSFQIMVVNRRGIRMDESNALLVEQFCQNDPTAFSKLVRRHYALVFDVCLRMLRHRQDAEDVTQETFARAARYLHRWDARRPLEPWLVAIAGNRCRTHLSRRTYHQSLVTDPIDREVGSQDADILREEIDLALASIPENQRHAFVMFHDQARSYIEIAHQLNCPLGTVKTWVHRARMAVIAHLREREIVPRQSAKEGRCGLR